MLIVKPYGRSEAGRGEDGTAPSEAASSTG